MLDELVLLVGLKAERRVALDALKAAAALDTERVGIVWPA